MAFDPNNPEHAALLEQLLASETDTLQPLGPGRLDTNVPDDYSMPAAPTPQASLAPLTIEGIQVPEGEGAKKRARMDALMEVLPLLMGAAPAAAGAGRGAGLSQAIRSPSNEMRLSREELLRMTPADSQAFLARNRPAASSQMPAPVAAELEPLSGNSFATGHTTNMRVPELSKVQPGRKPLPRDSRNPYVESPDSYEKGTRALFDEVQADLAKRGRFNYEMAPRGPERLRGPANMPPPPFQQSGQLSHGAVPGAPAPMQPPAPQPYVPHQFEGIPTRVDRGSKY